MQGIYEIVNLHDGKATAYVGSSADIEKRWQQHRARLRRGRHFNAHLQRTWDKYGKGAFEFCVVEEVADTDGLLVREQYWLDRYLESPSTCYNMAVTADKPPSCTGRVWSGESRRRLTEAKEGNPGAPGNTNALGYHHTKEAKSSISKSLVGNQRAKATAKPYPVFVHHKTGEVILAGVNLAAMCERHGLNKYCMYNVKNGKRPHHKGWMLASTIKEESDVTATI